jgi:RNA polymerase sigma factor for flagellar operon FliA
MIASTAPDSVTDALWHRFVSDRDAAVRARLVTAYQGFARMLAAKAYARRVYTEMEFDDYLQYGTVGLIESIDRFEPARGIRFETFAATRITGAILNGIEASSEIQEQVAARRRVIGQRLGTLRDAPAAPAPDSPAAVFASLAELAIGLAIGFVLEKSGMHMDAQAEFADNTYQAVELKQLQARVRAQVGALAPSQRRVIEGHYLQHLPFEEIARTIGVTRGRVAQLHKEALGNLRKGLGDAPEVDLCC